MALAFFLSHLGAGQASASLATQGFPSLGGHLASGQDAQAQKKERMTAERRRDTIFFMGFLWLGVDFNGEEIA